MSARPPPTLPAELAHRLGASLDGDEVHGTYRGVPYVIRRKPDLTYSLKLLGGDGNPQTFSSNPYDEIIDTLPLLMQHYAFRGAAPPPPPPTLSAADRALLAERVERSRKLGVDPEGWRAWQHH